jgi:subtilase family serine protease
MARFLDAPPGGGLLGGLLGSLPLGLGNLLGGSSTPAPAPPPATPAATSPHGFTAADLRSAYGITGAGAAGRTVAVVDAMDDPNAEADLAVYRATMGLPPCTTANGCFRKIDGSGGTNYPAPDAGWSKEISLDLEMVSAACSDCHILLVEAATQDIPVLGAAENMAASIPGVVAISNSFGVPEQAQETTWDAYFNHPGIAVTAASGDSGYGTVFPAVSPFVISVGGTTLTRDSSPRGWTESAWSGSGSGCSAYEPKPAWQLDTGCTRRTTADVSVVADPATGVAVYDSYQAAGWLEAGGTSAAAPFIAALYALAGNPAAQAAPGAYLYSHAAALHDVVSGSNGLLCFGNYLCSARAGYDGPTGLGTPSGLGAF